MEEQHQLRSKGRVALNLDSNVDLKFEQNEEKERLILEDPEDFNKVDSFVLLKNMEKQIQESAQQRPLEKELRIQDFSCHVKIYFRKMNMNRWLKKIVEQVVQDHNKGRKRS